MSNLSRYLDMMKKSGIIGNFIDLFDLSKDELFRGSFEVHPPKSMNKSNLAICLMVTPTNLKVNEYIIYPSGDDFIPGKTVNSALVNVSTYTDLSKAITEVMNLNFG